MILRHKSSYMGYRKGVKGYCASNTFRRTESRPSEWVVKCLNCSKEVVGYENITEIFFVEISTDPTHVIDFSVYCIECVQNLHDKRNHTTNPDYYHEDDVRRCRYCGFVAMGDRIPKFFHMKYDDISLHQSFCIDCGI